MEYTVDYFIKKFSKIPWYKWNTGTTTRNTFFGLIETHCAIGFCKSKYNYEINEETEALGTILSFLYKYEEYKLSYIWMINDGKLLGGVKDEYKSQIESCNSPKSRILKALNIVKTYELA